jgi:glutaredoxin-related protein
MSSFQASTDLFLEGRSLPFKSSLTTPKCGFPLPGEIHVVLNSVKPQTMDIEILDDKVLKLERVKICCRG